MKIITKIEGKDYKSKKFSKFIVAIIFSIEIFINNILPFVLGYYFAVTHNLIILGIWLVTFVFNIRFYIKKDNIQMKIIRGF